ncbi:hypothetical protein KP004_08300 [Geomonas oryzisoli]|uniref:Uncharacterized protein n=1 Tax=Geomonas oryzisoli TaxID=2847992 RepID=A0ABX8J9Y2_9BACT|nr:hypothetical protein [Geomonas oryzisoli]QWV95165.1 hypothetical protein KP004_08300 [Geomonas oryzisoli]
MLVNVVRFLFSLLLTSLVLAQPRPSLAIQSIANVVEIADVGKSHELASTLETMGYRCVVPEKNMWVVDQQSNCAVWIGKNVPLEMLRTVLPEAMRFNPHLKFFYVVGDRGEKPPQVVDNTVHVGGNIEAALVKKLNIIDQQEMLAQLEKAHSLEDLHRYLHDRNKPKPEQKPAS